MRRLAGVVALAMCLGGCGAVPPFPPGAFELAHSQKPTDGRNGECSLGWWTAGRLVVDGSRGTSIVVERGDVASPGAEVQVLWWPRYTARRVGNEAEVLDPDGNVVATTGRRYRIELAFPMQEDGGFVVCASQVTPLA
jgi:hypothetical protein